MTLKTLVNVCQLEFTALQGSLDTNWSDDRSIQSIMRSEMCSLHLTHPSVHTWSSGQPTVQRPGEQSWTSCRSRDSNPQPWVTSGFKSNALSIRPTTARVTSDIAGVTNVAVIDFILVILQSEKCALVLCYCQGQRESNKCALN